MRQCLSVLAVFSGLLVGCSERLTIDNQSGYRCRVQMTCKQVRNGKHLPPDQTYDLENGEKTRTSLSPGRWRLTCTREDSGWRYVVENYEASPRSSTWVLQPLTD